MLNKIIVLSFLIFSICFQIEAKKKGFNDNAKIRKYLKEFPYSNYEIYDVPQQGKFYVEPYLDDVVKNVLRQNITWESHLINYINENTKLNSIAIDIGGHIGTFTMVMAKKVGSKGKVHVFEPQIKLFRELYHNCILNKVENIVKCHQVAIGNSQKIIKIDSLKQGNEAGTHLDENRSGDFVNMRTIDSYNFKNVSFVKIDVEHSEDDVLDGMIETINRERPVIVLEIQGGCAWDFAPENIKTKIIFTKNKLENLGYRVDYILGHDYLAVPL